MAQAQWPFDRRYDDDDQDGREASDSSEDGGGENYNNGHSHINQIGTQRTQGNGYSGSSYGYSAYGSSAQSNQLPLGLYSNHQRMPSPPMAGSYYGPYPPISSSINNNMAALSISSGLAIGYRGGLSQGHDIGASSHSTTQINAHSRPGYQMPSSQGSSTPAQEPFFPRAAGPLSADQARMLDDSFRVVRIERQKNFFKMGRVFKTYWYQPVGSSVTERDAFTTIPLSQTHTAPFLEIRRFVVLKYHRRHSLCIPIHTYGRRGTTAPGADPRHHSQVYAGNQAPSLLAGEILYKRPIQIDLKPNIGEELYETSRLNYGKIYTVEHNIPVCEIGKVVEQDIASVLGYVNQVNHFSEQ